MERTVEDIAAKMDALGLWERVSQCNWAVCPKGTVFPYFCTAIVEKGTPVKVRFMMVEGWQTKSPYTSKPSDRTMPKPVDGIWENDSYDCDVFSFFPFLYWTRRSLISR